MKEGKAFKLNNQHKQQHRDGHFSPFKFAKLLDPEASWDKDQLGDVLHWIRQVVALVCGLLWGTIPVVGGLWIVAFLLISSGIVYGYYGMILKIDEEEFGGHVALLQEGLFASITVFLLGPLLIGLVHNIGCLSVSTGNSYDTSWLLDALVACPENNERAVYLILLSVQILLMCNIFISLTDAKSIYNSRFL